MSMPLSPAGTWTLDPAHTQVAFSIRHLGISTIRGQFTETAGTATIGGDLASSSIAVTAQATSIHTANAYRDQHLQAPDFFDAANHPELAFRSTALTASGDGYTLAGELTIKGVTKPVVFDLAFHGTGEFPIDQSTRAGFSASGRINRSDFGVSFGIPMASDEVGLQIDAQLVAPKAD